MEFAHRDSPHAGRALRFDDGIERRERDAHVGRMRCDAMLARAENRMDPIRPSRAAHPDPGARLLHDVKPTSVK